MANTHDLIGGLSNVMETQLAIYALTIEICASIIQTRGNMRLPCLTFMKAKFEAAFKVLTCGAVAAALM